MEEKKYPKIDPNGLCPHFTPCRTAIPEEVPTCDLCCYYCDDDTCHYPEVMQ